MILSDDSSRKDKIIDKGDLVTKFGNQTTMNKVFTSVYVFGRKISLWIPKDLWEKFRELAKLEGLSASKLAERALIEYARAHARGNPQLKMTYYVKPEEPQPMRVLCLYCQGALTDGRIFCQRKGMWVPGVSCYSCEFNRLRR